MKFVLPFLVATTLHAQIALGPERLATAPRFDGTSIAAAAAATDGTDTLVVVQPGGPDGALYLQRLGADAETLTAHGVPIARGVAMLGGIASNRNGYVVAYTTADGIVTLSIGANGDVSAPRVVGGGGRIINWLRIASNGTDYLAAWTETTATTQQAMAMRLDGNGNPVGNPFALSAPQQSAGILALDSDGRDYLAAVDGYASEAKTTLVPVSANGTVGAKAGLPLFLRSVVHTNGGYIGLVEDSAGTKAIAVDANGHLGAPAIISSDTFESATSNGTDALSIGFRNYYPASATRIRRNGDAIETIEHITLMTQPFSAVVAGATHAGRYFTISFSYNAPAGVAEVTSPAVAEHPLLTFATTQAAPAIASDGDLRVIAWREGTIVRAARLRGDTTLDPAGLDVANTVIASGFPSYGLTTQYALAVSAGRTLIAWTELGYTGSEFPALQPVRVRARVLAADGTFSAPVTIASISGMETPLGINGVVATSRGFAVLFGPLLRVANVDAGGNVTGVTPLDLPDAGELSVAPRADGFLVVTSEVPKNVLTAAPFHADGTPAGPRQIVSGSLDRQNFPAVAADGSGHFLVVWMENDRWLARTVDENGAPLGTARDFGTGGRPSVTWNGSMYVAVSGEDMALFGADGRVLEPLSPALPPRAQQSVIAADTMATLHSGIDAGVGDEFVVFVRRFSVGRHRAARR
jgi:hypothetical protein